MSAKTIYTPICDECGPLGDFSNYDRAAGWLLRHVDDPSHESHRGRVVPRVAYYTSDRSEIAGSR